MSKPYTCATSDARIKPTPEHGVLSVIVPTFNRPSELELAVTSIAEQIRDGLESKVEIIISDNASGQEHQAMVRTLADRHGSVSYYLNAENVGPGQIGLAPWRARCRWHWLFGDDDALIPGGVGAVVQALEREGPAFLSLNRCIADDTLSNLLSASKNSLPTTRYVSFLEMLRTIGVDQLSFFTSQIYLTEPARQTDPSIYINSQSYYSQIAYYLDAFHALPAMYLEDVFVIHRWQPTDLKKHGENFYHLAATLPPILAYARDLHGLNPRLFEDISGERSASLSPKRALSFVDNILRHIWRCIAMDVPLKLNDWAFLECEALNWRPERLSQLAQARQAQAAIEAMQKEWLQAQLELESNTATGGGALGRLANVQISARLTSLSAAMERARQAAMDESERYD